MCVRVVCGLRVFASSFYFYSTLVISLPILFLFRYFYQTFRPHWNSVSFPQILTHFYRNIRTHSCVCVCVCVCCRCVANKLLTNCQACVLFVNFLLCAAAAAKTRTDKLSDKRRRLPHTHIHTESETHARVCWHVGGCLAPICVSGARVSKRGIGSVCVCVCDLA